MDIARGEMELDGSSILTEALPMWESGLLPVSKTVALASKERRDDVATDDICPTCCILKGEVLRPETYETIWDAVPHLRADQDASEAIHCEECGRQLTFGEGEV